MRTFYVILALLAMHAEARLNAAMDTRIEAHDPAEDAEAGASCAKNNLCSKCLHDPDCVWCADGAGSCVPGSSKGPSDSAQCKSWEGSYCRAEPCGMYTSCATCVADPFCGFAGGHKDDMVCVEGHKLGPLTGKVLGKWYYTPKSCPSQQLPEGVTKEMMSITGGAGVDAEAANALKTLDGKAKSTAADDAKVRADESKMMATQKKAFDVMKHLRVILDEWRSRRAKVQNAKKKDEDNFMGVWEDLVAKRRKSIEWLVAGIKDMYGVEAAEQALMQKRNAQEGMFEEGENVDDAKVSAEGNDDNTTTLDHLTTLREDKSMMALSGWLKNMTSGDRHLLKVLARTAGNEIEKELHYAAERRMAREEAGWYACAYILSSPEDNLCNDFHERYSGTEKKRDLTEEEHTRVCNMVKAQLDRTQALPVLKGSKAGRKNILLAWCVNNIHM
jgi:hypothetical protein